MNQEFSLSKTAKAEMVDQIKLYFYEEKHEQLGDLAATLLLDFFMEKLAPTFYNLGVEDAHSYLHEKLEDLFEIQKK